MKTLECQFESDGTTCAGTLVHPDAGPDPPVIIIAHGFGAIREARLPAFAERFTAAGYAAFLFDYRTFGGSEGEPRHWVHPGRQLEDWNAAIRYVRSRPDIYPEGLILWGTSFSGGHVLHLAASEDAFAAVIAQIPHVSGPATVRPVPLSTVIKTSLAGIGDTLASLFGQTIYRPISGEPGSCAAVTGDNAVESYRRLIPDGAAWTNRVLSRSFLQVPLYSPRRGACRISAPVLMVTARHDSVVPASAAVRTARRIPDCELNILDADHFEPYFGEMFERNIALQIEFLRRRVPVGAGANEPGN